MVTRLKNPKITTAVCKENDWGEKVVAFLNKNIEFGLNSESAAGFLTRCLELTLAG